MKFTLKSKYLQLIVVFSLMALQSGQAFSEEPKTSPPKAEAAAKPVATAKTSPTDPVIKVNDKVITRGEVERATKMISAQNRTGQPIPENAVIDQLVSVELLYQAGFKLGVPDLDKQVAEKITQIKAQFPDNAAFENKLKSDSLTQKELEEQIRKSIIISNLVDKEITSKITVSEADAKKFYDENIDKFKQGESIRASHILCKVDPEATANEKNKAKEKAEGLLKQIKAGKDFAELAKTNSDDSNKAQGGDLGFFGKGQMVPTFENAAFALKPGEVSNVVETQFGYHIIKVTEKKGAGVASFNEAKTWILERLKGMKIQKYGGEYVAQLKEKAKIEKVTN